MEMLERMNEMTDAERIDWLEKRGSVNMNWVKRIFCSHRFEFTRNIYGDEIIERGWKRSIWKCSQCGKTEDRDALHNA